MTFTEPSRIGPIRSVWIMLCFSRDGSMVHAGPRHTPSMNANVAMASRWALMSAAESGRPCPKTVTVAPMVISSNANVASGCLIISSSSRKVQSLYTVNNPKAISTGGRQNLAELFVAVKHSLTAEDAEVFAEVVERKALSYYCPLILNELRN